MNFKGIAILFCRFVPFKTIGLALTLVISSTTFAADARTEKSEKSDTSAAWQAIKEMQKGNSRFAEGEPNHSGQTPSQREKLAEGQKPPVIVLSCSDSRVPPEKIFDQGLGQVFTIRLAGHVVNSDALASIEYALEHLGAKSLVVLGHESCDTVKAALTTPTGKSTGSPHVDGLIGKIRPNIAHYRDMGSEDKTLRGPVKANVTSTVKELIKRSKIIRERIEKDQLLIAQGIYSLASGKVDFWSVGQPIVIVEPAARVPAQTFPSSYSKEPEKYEREYRKSGKSESWKSKSTSHDEAKSDHHESAESDHH